MSRPQNVMFPCVLLAILALVRVTSLISGTGTAEASDIAFNMNDALTNTPAANPASSNENQGATNQPGASPASANENQTQGASNSCTLSTKFSDSILQWCSLIESQANQYNLDPGLVAAVMLEESGGNPSA